MQSDNTGNRRDGVGIEMQLREKLHDEENRDPLQGINPAECAAM